MKKVLIVHYSQTGQLSSLARNFAAPLQTAGIQVDCVNIVPEQAFPFPWPFWRFFDTFPETVHLKPTPILPRKFHPKITMWWSLPTLFGSSLLRNR